MDSKRTQSSNLSQLLALQQEARAYVAKHEWFAEHLRTGFAAYVDLVEGYYAIRNKQEWYARCRARVLLALGGFRDHNLQESDDPYIVQFPYLSTEMQALERARDKHRGMDTNSSQYNSFQALTALEILELDLDQATKRTFLSPYLSHNIPIKKSEDWQDPADPTSLDVAILTQHSGEQYHLIALFRIGGLIDFANPRPVIPMPDSPGDSSGLLEPLWKNRSPGGAQTLSQLEASGVGPDLLTVYTRFWEHLKNTVKRGKDPVTTKPRKTVPVIEYDQDDMRPAGKFPKRVQERLRKASKPDRTSKPVRSIRVDNVTLYSYSDAEQNWPEEFAETDDRE